jgi:hypothetical protein
MISYLRLTDNTDNSHLRISRGIGASFRERALRSCIHDAPIIFTMEAF